jgi:hypothetical protein
MLQLNLRIAFWEKEDIDAKILRTQPCLWSGHHTLFEHCALRSIVLLSSRLSPVLFFFIIFLNLFHPALLQSIGLRNLDASPTNQA